MNIEQKELLDYLIKIGLDVHTSTKARGHQGFFVKKRIDISKNISNERFMPTLLHEFAHYIHSQIEPFMEKNGGTLEVVFDDDNISFYQDELLKVTNFVDANSKFEKLLIHKQLLKDKIKEYESIIKQHYPKFQRSKSFKEFNAYIKKSDAKYLLKYDRVKVIKDIFGVSSVNLSIDTIENDFPDMPKEFVAYIRLKSITKKISRISSRISKLKKYYSKPAELFARLIEGIYIDNEKIKQIAPNSYKRFCELLHSGYYNELSYVERFI